MNENERLRQLSTETYQRMISVFTAECYGLFKNYNTDGIDINNLQLFTSEFNKFAIGAAPMIFFMYDADTESFYSIHVPRVEVLTITETPSNDPSMLAVYGITANVIAKYTYEGDAEKLYNVTKDVRTEITKGWRKINRARAIPALTITPYDLCAGSNFHELLCRLAYFTKGMMISRSKYQDITSLLNDGIVNIEDIWCMDVFFNHVLVQLLGAIKLPYDMDIQRLYTGRALVKYHEDKETDDFVNLIHKVYLPNENKETINRLRYISLSKEPEVVVDTFTTYYE